MKTTAFIVSLLTASCTSVTVRSPDGTLVNIGNTFGRGEVAEVRHGATVVKGFRSDHTEVTKEGIGAWLWSVFWKSDAVNDIADGTADVLTSAGEAIKH